MLTQKIGGNGGRAFMVDVHASVELAHGFVVLSETAEFLYKTTDYYAPQHERCIAWNDPDLAIDWPIDGQPLLSAKDAAGAAFREAE